MYTDASLKPIAPTAPYTAADGTKYPWNYPKDEIKGLVKVEEAARPADTDEVEVTGFVINEKHVQVWQTRQRTTEERADRIAGRLRPQARSFLSASDLTVLRCLEAGISVPQAWVNYRAALRAIIASGTGDIPVRPAYPEGT